MKYTVQCCDCDTQFKTKKPTTQRRCPICKAQTTFIIVNEQPLMNKRKRQTIQCLRCEVLHSVTQIPSKCSSCNYPFSRKEGDQTLTDVIYRLIMGGSVREAGYMKVDVSRDGAIWWTPESPDDDMNPFIGDAQQTGQYSFYGQGESLRDDLRPTIRKRMK
jgi:ribosomal protein L37E